MPIIKLLVEGGNMTPGPAVAQQLGPMGINMGKVISDVNEQTKSFKGINVPVILDVDAKTKEFTISVSSPPTSELIKKELGLETASGERKKNIAGNISVEQLISVTKQKHEHMLAREFLSALKSVIGTCMALGIIIENKDPKDFLEEVKKGTYKEEIDSQKTELSPEKKKGLDEYYSKIKAKQDKVKAEEKAAEEAEAKPEEDSEKATEKPEEKSGEKKS